MSATRGFFPSIPRFSRPVLAFLLVACVATSGRVRSQTWDPAFKPRIAQNGQVRALALQPDGRILVLGTFDRVGAVARDGLARLNADGSLDPSFVPPAGLAASAQTLQVQPDGRILLGGRFSTGNMDPFTQLETFHAFRRLNADGSPDPSFSIRREVGESGNVSAVFGDEGNRFFALVNFSSFHHGVRNVSSDLLRVHDDTGGLDPWDHLTAAYFGELLSGGRLADGSVVISGDFTQILAPNRLSALDWPPVARISAGGILDINFKPRLAGDGWIRVSAVRVTANNRVLIGGNFTMVNDQPRPGVARLTASGALDGSFNPTVGTGFGPGYGPGIGSGVNVSTLLPLADGGVLVAGYFFDLEAYRLIRLNPNGSVDTAWNFPKTYGFEFNALAEASGGVLVGGDLRINQGGGTALLRAGPGGAVDASFNSRLERPGGVRSIALQSDGKVVIGGRFASINGTPRTNLARLHPDGSLDTSYATETIRGGVSVVRTLPDNKLLVGGNFPSIGLSQRRGLARLQTNGTVDNTFVPALAADSQVYDLAPAPNGRVLICGEVISSGGVARRKVIRFETNGAVDSTFQLPALSSPGFFDATVRSVETLPSGQVLIGGDFNRVGSVSRQAVARLLESGNLDPAFDAGEFGDPFLRAPSVQGVRAGPGGRVFVCGSFQTIRGQSISSFAAFDADGSLIPGYTESFRSISVNTLGVNALGVVSVGEGFGDRLQVFEPAGTKRLPFGGLATPGVFASAVQPNGDVLFGGDFSLPGLADGLGRLLAVPIQPPQITSPPTSLVVEAGESAAFTVQATSATPLSFQWLHDGLPLSGETRNTLEFTQVTRAHAGHYQVQVRNESGETPGGEASLIVLGGVQLNWGPEPIPDTFRLTGRAPDGGPFTTAELDHYAVDVSSDLREWLPLDGSLQITPDGTAAWSEPFGASPQAHFYRARRK